MASLRDSGLAADTLTQDSRPGLPYTVASRLWASRVIVWRRFATVYRMASLHDL